jgi:hypothetical protein
MTEVRNADPDAETSSYPTLASKILDVGRLRALNDKSKTWFNIFSDLWMNAGGPNALQTIKGTPDGYDDADYIAVSYSWTLMPRLECDRNGKYAVTGQRGECLRKSVVRDEVLERALRYANYIGICRLWIARNAVRRRIRWRNRLLWTLWILCTVRADIQLDCWRLSSMTRAKSITCKRS